MIDLRSVRDVVSELIVDPLLDWIMEKAVHVDGLGRLDTEGDAAAGLAAASGEGAPGRGDAGAPERAVPPPDEVGGDWPLDAVSGRR